MSDILLAWIIATWRTSLGENWPYSELVNQHRELSISSLIHYDVPTDLIRLLYTNKEVL
jgi:hypothetical protein